MPILPISFWLSYWKGIGVMKSAKLKCTTLTVTGGVLDSLNFYWAPDILEFLLGRFSHFNIAIVYSNSKFCGAWTPSFCEFTSNFSKTSTPLISNFTFTNKICYKYRRKWEIYGNKKLAIIPIMWILCVCENPKFTVWDQSSSFPRCARFSEIWLKYFEFHILWSLSSVDFHTLTLQLPIQIALQVFASSLAI